MTDVRGGSAKDVGAAIRASLRPNCPRQEGPWAADKQVEWFEFRRKHSSARCLELDRLSLAELATLADADLVEAVTRRVFDQKVRRGYRGLSVAARTFWLLENLFAEVVNGGFHTFFLNSSGDFAAETLDAVRATEMAELVSLYERVLARFPGTPSTSRAERIDALETLPSETWSEYDREFFTRYSDNDPAWGVGLAHHARAVLDKLALEPTECQRVHAIAQVTPGVAKLALPIDTALQLTEADERQRKLASVIARAKLPASEQQAILVRLERLRAAHFDPQAFAAGSLSRVRHATFGDGVIEREDGDKVTVYFDDGSVKTLARRFVTKLY